MTPVDVAETAQPDLSETAPEAPPSPLTLEETGLPESQVLDLLLKALHELGAQRGDQLAHFVALPFSVIDDLLLTMQQRHFVEVLGTEGHGRAGYMLSLTEEGRRRARAALDGSRYVGPAPVPLEQFREWVERQSIRQTSVSRANLIGAFEDLVFPDEVFDALGPAVNSGSSIFLHGAPGNGKTAIAERLGRLTSNTIYLPHALTLDGQVIVLLDPVYHHPADGTFREKMTDDFLKAKSWDRRFVLIQRPVVFVGGELTLDQLDLRYDPYSKVYQAPFQLKASGGILIIDDFGRQRAKPAELLNRWIVPLEKSFDNLTFHSGLKFPVPFDCLLVFATNLNPRDLVDEAFLRRIQFKVEIKSPTREGFAEILEMNCGEHGIEYSPDAVDLLFKEFYDQMGFPPRGCHPRDILHQIEALASFREESPKLTPEAIRQAARSYFLVMEEEYVSGVPSIRSGSRS